MSKQQTALQLRDLQTDLLDRAVLDPGSLSDEERARLRKAGRMVGSFGDDLSEEGRRLRGQVASDPTALMRVLSLPSSLTRITPIGVGRAMDGLVASVGSEHARELVDDNLTVDRQVEGLMYLDDLPSSFRMVADKDALLAAIMTDVTGSGVYNSHEEGGFGESLLGKAILARRWAFHIQDRDDYEEILESRIGGQLTLYELCLLALWTLAGRPRVTLSEGGVNVEFAEHGITPDNFHEIGLDPDQGMEDLAVLLDSGIDLTLDPEEMAAFLKELDKRRKTAEKASSVEEADAEAARDAEDAIDF